jgi:phosphate:Na+ symporter
VELLEDSLHQLAAVLDKPWRGGALEPLVENLIETTDFLLMFAGEAARTLEQDRAELLVNLSGDRSEMMVGVRALYLAPDRSLNIAERALLLRLTALFERIVWMVQRYAELLLKNLPQESEDRIVN